MLLFYIHKLNQRLTQHRSPGFSVASCTMITMSHGEGHLRLRSGSMDTIYNVDHQSTFPAMFGLTWLSGLRWEDCYMYFPTKSYVKLYLSKLVILHGWRLEITCTLHIKMIRVYKAGAALIMHYMIHVLFFILQHNFGRGHPDPG